VVSTEEAVLFEHRSSRLRSQDQATLDRVARQLLATPDGRLLIMVPDNAVSGTNAFTDARLMTLETELTARGINPDTISMRGGGGRGWVILRVEHSMAMAAADPGLSAEPLGMAGGYEGEAGQPQLLLPVEPAAKKPSAEAPPLEEPATAVTEGEETPSADVWDAPVGSSLQAVLEDWASRAGWSLVYRSDRRFPVEASATFEGDFVTVAGALVEAFGSATPAPLAQFYTGNRVLVVSSGEGR
jgi:hypothetical protein